MTSGLGRSPEHHRELIHYYIPSLPPRLAIGEVSNIEEQDLDDRIIIREDLTSRDALSHLRMQAFNRIGGVNGSVANRRERNGEVVRVW